MGSRSSTQNCSARRNSGYSGQGCADCKALCPDQTSFNRPHHPPTQIRRRPSTPTSPLHAQSDAAGFVEGTWEVEEGRSESRVDHEKDGDIPRFWSLSINYVEIMCEDTSQRQGDIRKRGGGGGEGSDGHYF